MFERIEPAEVFAQRMVKWPIDEIWEEIHSNNQAIFFYLLDLKELDDLSSIDALKIQAWIEEFDEDNKMMQEELNSRLEKQFMPYLRQIIDECLKGGPDA